MKVCQIDAFVSYCMLMFEAIDIRDRIFYNEFLIEVIWFLQRCYEFKNINRDIASIIALTIGCYRYFVYEYI